MITESDKRMYLLHAKTIEFLTAVSTSRSIINEAITKCKKPYVAFSGGKDSTVLAHLVLQHKKDVELQFLESGESTMLHDFDRVFAEFINLTGAIVTRIKIDRLFTEEWRSADWDTTRKAGKYDIQTLLGNSNDCVFMGLRKEESYHRRRTLTEHGTLYYYKNKNVWRCCPLADWTTKDIGAYLISNNLPYLDTYQQFGFEQRTTARLTGDAARCHALVWLKKKNTAAYNQLLQRFPEWKDLV